jgi:hypothetical protein
MSVPGEFNQHAIRYVADDGQTFTVSQKLSNAIAVGNTVVPRGNNQGFPERWRLRYIWCATIYGGKYYKRQIIVGDANNPVFVGTKKTVQLDGQTWMVKGRKGESTRG